MGRGIYGGAGCARTPVYTGPLLAFDLFSVESINKNRLMSGVKIPAMSLGIDASAALRFGDHEKSRTTSAITDTAVLATASKKQEMCALIGCVLPGPEFVEG